MIVAMLKVMWLRLWRDKGAFLLAFILPGAIFAVFAAIFSTASGGNLDLRVAMSADRTNPAINEIANDMLASDTLTLDEQESADDVSESVRLGQYDVGFAIIGTGADGPVFRIYSDPGRAVAASVLKGQLRQVMADRSGIDAPELFADESVLESSDSAPADQSVTYYIGATAILFLLFSAMQAANLSIEERRSGLSDRLMLGLKGLMGRLTGRLIFLTIISIIQIWIIIAVAAVFFDVSVIAYLPSLVLASILTALVSAAIALLVTSLCATQTQMHAVSTFLVLLFSAVGGSMVPSFMMPGWLQSLGHFTPNHWVIEAFYGILARGQSVAQMWPIWSVLLGITAICLISAVLISHRLQRG